MSVIEAHRNLRTEEDEAEIVLQALPTAGLVQRYEVVVTVQGPGAGREDVQDVYQAANRERKDFIDNMHRELDNLDATLDQLDKRIKTTAKATEKSAEERLQALRKQTKAVRGQVMKVAEAAVDSWQELRKGVENAYNELRTATTEAGREIDEATGTKEADTGKDKNNK